MLPPNMISTKDFSYLEDMLNWNLLAMKKIHFFASQVKDEEVKQAIEKVGKMHQQHYLHILQHLEQ